MDTIEIKKVEDFLMAINGVKKHLYKDHESLTKRKLWFRGHNEFGYYPKPNIYRNMEGRKLTEYPYKMIKNYEANVDSTFYRGMYSLNLNQGYIDNRWFRYFLKQHYGLTTRLLDWTENALIALYFAAEDLRIEEGEIFILDPYKVNSAAIKELGDNSKYPDAIFMAGQFHKKSDVFINGVLNPRGLLYEYLTLDIDNSKNYYPIAIYPPLFDERMKMQQSCFTIYGNILEDTLSSNKESEYLFKFKVSNKLEIQDQLSFLGIKKSAIFPGLESFCEDVKKEFDFYLKTESSISTLYNYMEKFNVDKEE